MWIKYSSAHWKIIVIIVDGLSVMSLFVCWSTKNCVLAFDFVFLNTYLDTFEITLLDAFISLLMDEVLYVSCTWSSSCFCVWVLFRAAPQRWYVQKCFRVVVKLYSHLAQSVLLPYRTNFILYLSPVMSELHILLPFYNMENIILVSKLSCITTVLRFYR